MFRTFELDMALQILDLLNIDSPKTLACYVGHAACDSRFMQEVYMTMGMLSPFTVT
jgi:hypothetical protein